MHAIPLKTNNFNSMKKNIKIIVFALLIIGSSISCEDYLETDSNSTFTEETAFSNLDFATKAVFGIYGNITSYYMYTYHLGLFYKCDTDIELSLSEDNGSNRSLAHYAGTEGSTGLDRVWNLMYQTIERANICIDNLPQSPIWEGEYSDEAHRLYGEAVTLRALLYYELVNLWGDVPFKVKSTQDGDDYYLPKTDRDLIYEHLIQDLADVEEYVPWMTVTGTAERVNRAFVKGLRARMALSYAGYSLRNTSFETRRGRYWEDYYKIANEECREIMESGKHTLNPDFENIFKTIHAYSQDLTYKEVLFEVPYGRTYSGRVAYSIGMKHRSNDTKYGKAAAEICVAPNYFYSFNRNDIRRDVSVALFDYNNSKNVGKQYLLPYNKADYYKPTKWRRSWIDPALGGGASKVSYTGVNWPLMRYADVILMFAESENEMNGPTPAAKSALSLVRQRAFSEGDWATDVVNYVDSVSTNKESFFNAIVDERAWEFGGEMLRKYDLVRWNLLGTKLDEMQEDCQKLINGDPKYAHVPTYIYWKYLDDNETIEILNPDYEMPSSVSVEGYTKSSWIPKMSDSHKSTYTYRMSIAAHGYDRTKNNHLYPIHSDVLSASNGMLTNDQIP
ncbi:RagB/SusD family nutrient uptake outer membrane protein [Mariniphaga sediminis]|uniref:RagB/SusD family nutrient uptake outer membrane protein n=2 Tax=Mariniphaga sediminis TaxID=1628158 RepID=A0A399D6T9_9BACT|nr:RagB/SusD family nutrient uptake outer membrane protein [Mariniphaga sediminis]